MQRCQRKNFGGLRRCGWTACRMRVIRRRVRSRHRKRRRIGKTDKRERWLRRRRQQRRRKAVPDHAGDTFEMACRDPIMGIGGALLIDRTADRRQPQLVRLAGACGHGNCRKRRLQNQGERREPDRQKTDRAETVAAANTTNRSSNFSEPASRAHPPQRWPFHPLRDELTLIKPRLHISPYRCRCSLTL